MIMDIEKILMETTLQTGIKLTKKDPFIALLVLNKIILAESVEEIKNQIAESITEIAIKEDVTVKRLKKFLDDKQTETIQLQNKELQRFKDEIAGIKNDFISQLENPVSKRDNLDRVWYMISVFLGGIIIGTGATTYFLNPSLL